MPHVLVEHRTHDPFDVLNLIVARLETESIVRLFDLNLVSHVCLSQYSFIVTRSGTMSIHKFGRRQLRHKYKHTVNLLSGRNMIKTSFGAPIGYGPTLPPAGLTADGVLFFKTATDAGGPPGLYLYGFQFDVSSSIAGEQVGQGWKIASDLTNYLLKSGDTVTGPLVFTYAGPPITLQSASPGIRFTETDQVADGKEWLLVADGGVFQVQTRNDAFNTSSTVFSLSRSGVLLLNGQTVWTAGNDGTGSGLDAGLLGGLPGSYYLSLANSVGTLDLNARTSGTLTVSRGGTNLSSVTVGGIVYGASATQYGFTATGVAGQILQSNGTAPPSWVSASGLAASSADKLTTARQIALSGNATGSLMFDGSANVSMSVTVSNSAALAGLLPSASGTGSSVAVRDSSGDLYAQHLNQASANSENLTISQVMVTNGSDGFLRKASVAALASALTSVGLSGYVAKTGDSMSGSLIVGDGSGDYIQVNGITLNYNGSTIVTTGPVTASQFNGSGAGLTGTAGSLSIGGNAFTATTATNSLQLGGVLASGYAQLTGATFSGDLHTYRTSAPATGVIYLDQTNAHYLYFDATNYNLPTGGLILGGTLTASGDVIAYSDRRIKKNISTVENALDKVKALRGVEFDRIEDDAHSVGLIAQEVQEVIPSVVRESPDGTLGVAYGNLVGVLVEAIKEQQKQIEVLTARLNKLVD
jgi:hypothetical protein